MTSGTNGGALDWKARLYGSYVSSEQAAFRPSTEWSIHDFPQVEHLIRAHVPADPALRIVDLGCGHGTLLRCLGELGYRNVEGVDVSAEQVELAHSLGRSNVSLGDSTEFIGRFREEIDVVFLMDVLEHFDRQSSIDLLDAVQRALREGGRAVIHVPNAEGIFGMRVRYGDVTHETAYTAQSIAQLLKVCGFHAIEVFEDRPVVHGLKSFVRHWLWRILTLRERLLLLAEAGSAQAVLSQNMVVVARKLSRAEPTPGANRPASATNRLPADVG